MKDYIKNMPKWLANTIIVFLTLVLAILVLMYVMLFPGEGDFHAYGNYPTLEPTIPCEYWTNTPIPLTPTPTYPPITIPPTTTPKLTPTPSPESNFTPAPVNIKLHETDDDLIEWSADKLDIELHNGYMLVHLDTDCTEGVIHSGDFELARLGEDYEGKAMFSIPEENIPINQEFGLWFQLKDGYGKVQKYSLSSIFIAQEISTTDIATLYDELYYIFASGENVIGCYEDFAQINNLKMLSLRSTSIQGDFLDLADCAHLVSFMVYNEVITGDLGDLAAIDSLRRLYMIKCMNVNMRQNSIAALTHLKHLTIGGWWDIGFDFNALSNLKDLEYLDLVWIDYATGELEDLAGLTKLKYLNIDYMEYIQGDFSAFRDMHDLEYFRISGYDTVTGDISSISNCKNMKRLIIYADALQGDLKDLRYMKNLNYLDIGTTSVGGDIANLAKLRNLKMVFLNDNESIYGDVSSLSAIDDLRYISFDYSENLYGVLVMNNGYVHKPDEDE